jgi:hypothetical protein
MAIQLDGRHPRGTVTRMLIFKVRILDISKASKSPSVRMIGTSNTLHVSCIGELTEAQTTPLCVLAGSQTILFKSISHHWPGFEFIYFQT